MTEFLVESGEYKGLIMKISRGQITYMPNPKKPEKPDPIEMELTTGLATPDSPINRHMEESSSDDEYILEEVEVDTESECESECECEPVEVLELLINNPRLSKITGNKLKKHFAETDVPPEKMMLYYGAVVDALIKKKTFNKAIELGEFACL